MDGAQISALMAIKDDPVRCVLLKPDGSAEEVRELPERAACVGCVGRLCFWRAWGAGRGSVLFELSKCIACGALRGRAASRGRVECLCAQRDRWLEARGLRGWRSCVRLLRVWRAQV